MLDGLRFQTLEGITGSGKTATIAWMVEQLQRPTLVIEPNKSLAAQLAAELKDMLPDNRVEFFVSYYDYYQPEAYIARTDTYIEKDSSINDEIDRLRHASTSSLLTRRDTLVVASVSCIYGLGSPEEYRKKMVSLVAGEECEQRALLRRLVDMHYSRNDMTLLRGTFRVRGDTIELLPSYEQEAIRLSFFGDTLERIALFDPLTGDVRDDRRGRGRLRRVALRRRRRDDGQGDRLDRGRARRCGSRSSSRRASSWRSSGSARAPSTTSRCSPRPGRARGSRTTRATSTAASQASGPTPCSTTSPRTSSSSSTSRTSRSRS